MIVAIDYDTRSLRQMKEAINTVYPNDEVVTFTDPMLAVKYVLNNPVSHVFTEVNMRACNGFQTTLLVKNMGKSVLVYFVVSSDEYMQQAQISGIDGYFLKPVSAKAIRNANKLCEIME